MSLQHRLLTISSKDRSNLSSSNSDFSVNINNVKEIQKAKTIIIKQVSFPNVFYNIDNNNRTFTYNIAASPTSVQIAAGQYTITTLITALVAAASAVTLGITQNAITKKLSFTTGTAIEFLDITENPMAEILGIKYGAGSGSDVTSFTATGLPDLNGISEVFIESLTLGESNLIRTNGKTISMLCVIPITAQWGYTEHYTTDHSEIDDIDSYEIYGKNHQSIDIKLVDINGNTLDLHGHHIALVLKIYY